MTSAPSHRELLERIAAGDPAAFQETVDRYGDLVWSLAHRFTETESDAEDAVQDIFVTLWKHASRFDPSKGQEVTFVSILARRRLIDRYRRGTRQVKAYDIDLSGTPPARPAAGFSSHDIDAAMAAYSELDDKHQNILRLSICHGLTHEKIADATGMPLGTVKTTIRRGLTKIREHLAMRHERTGLAR